MSTDASVIEDLVQTLEDGREGYARAAERLDGSEHSQFVMMFREFSAQRDRFSAELRNLRPGEQTDSDGTLLGDLHRGWIALKDALTGDNVEAVLKAVTTGENHAVSEYDKALESDLSSSLRAIVERQRAEIIEARNRVETLAGART